MKPHVRSQVIRLLRNIMLSPQKQGGRASVMFLARVESVHGLTAEVSMSWWFNSHSRSAQAALASLLIKSSPDLSDCDQKTASEVVLITLQEICIDRGVFYVEDVIFARGLTLFDCMVHDVENGAALILSAILLRLRARIGRCCTVFAIPRFVLPSFNVPDQGIHLIAKGDRAGWHRLVEDGYMVDDWWPSQHGSYILADSVFSLPEKYESLIVVEGAGTRRGTRFSSIMKSRVLGAVIFCVSSASAEHRYHKSAASPFGFCVQYPHSSDPMQTAHRNDCAPIVPYYASEIPLNATGVLKVQRWYEKLNLCGTSIASRIEKSAHFFNLGMNANGVEAYVNFFVALDALLGRRGAVEASIISGLEMLQFSNSDVQRAKWLFELRSELVHGGSRYIEEWKRYPRYLRFFESEPLHDVQQLARDAVLKAPELLT